MSTGKAPNFRPPSGVNSRRLLSVAAAAALAASACSSASDEGRVLQRQPGCTSSVGAQNILPGVRTDKLPVPGRPFDVVSTADGKRSFVSLGNSIGVLSNESFRPELVTRIPLPGMGLGEALTHDGRLLLVADGSGVDVLDAGLAERGDLNPILGLLRPPDDRAEGGAIEVAVAPDDRYVFATRENGRDVAVFDLRKAERDGYGSSSFVGSVPLGGGPVGIAASPDGRYLYATSQVGAPPRTTPGRVSATAPDPNEGTLSVIDLARAVSDPMRSVVSAVWAGCNPVRVVTSADGKTLWVTARASNAVLAFSAAGVRRDPRHALLAHVPVGEAPVGIILVRHDTRLIVANSNRFTTPGASANLSVIDTAAALRGRPAVLGVIASGAFPRQLALQRDGKVLLVTNYASEELQVVDLTTVR